MRERGWGRIVNVASSSTREPIPGLALSNAHRPGLIGFLKTLAREVAADGVTVNDVATGRFATDRLAANWGGWEEMRGARGRRRPGGPARARRRSTATWSPSSCSERAGLPHRHLDPDRRRAAALGLGAGVGSAAERRLAGRPRARRGCALRASQTPPAAIIATLSSCAWVSPSATSSLRRMNSTRKRSAPARTR